MKCTKCGADCDPRQMFCLRCGTPLNINKNDEEVIKEVEVPIGQIVNPIHIEEEDDDIDMIIGRDLSRINNRNKKQPEPMPKSEKVEVEVEDEQEQKTSVMPKKPSTNNDDKSKKIIIAAIIGIVVTMIVLVVILISVLSGGIKNYNSYYEQGMKLYTKGKVEEAIVQFENAAEQASSFDENIKVYTVLWESYSKLDGYDDELIRVLKELIKLDSTNQIYYEALIVVYQGNDDQKAIEELIDSISDKELRDKLRDVDATIPVATLAPGEFDKPISVGLTAIAGSTIYYNINEGDASESDNVYTNALEFEEEGTYIIKAVAIDSKGNVSGQFEGKYILDFGTVNPPEVNLASGTYNEVEEIEVTCDEGCKIYYEKSDTVPTENSIEYTEPIEMPKENTIFTFIAIDEDGISSDIVTRIYNFKEEFEYDYNDAITSLSKTLVTFGIMENTFGTYEDGSAMYLAFSSVEEIDEEYYYIIEATKETESGSLISTETYAVGCNSCEPFATKMNAGAYELKDIE